MGNHAQMPRMHGKHGFVFNTTVTHATGTAECEAALAMLTELNNHHRVTFGTSKKYNNAELVAKLRELNVARHVAQNLKAPG